MNETDSALQGDVSAEFSEEAASLIAECFVIDAYCCPGQRLDEPSGWFGRRGDTQVDFVKAVEGGINVFGCSLGDGVRTPIPRTDGTNITERVRNGEKGWEDLPWPPDLVRPYGQKDWPRSHLAKALMNIDIFLREIDLLSGKAFLIKEGRQIRQCYEEGKTGLILHGNTVPMFEDSIEVLHILHRLGMRMLILARAGRNLVCDGFMETRTRSRLTTFGVGVVRELNRLGIIIDASHMSESCFYDLLEVSEKPVICSHSNSKALCPHPRNLTDNQVKALAESGGVVGLTFVPYFIDIDAPPEYRGYTPDSPLFEKWVDHCERYIDIVGPDLGGIGSDFDGGGNLLQDMSRLPQLVEALLRRGFPRDTIKKIMGVNWLRIFEKVMHSADNNDKLTEP